MNKSLTGKVLVPPYPIGVYLADLRPNLKYVFDSFSAARLYIHSFHSKSKIKPRSQQKLAVNRKAELEKQIISISFTKYICKSFCGSSSIREPAASKSEASQSAANSGVVLSSRPRLGRV